MQGSTPEYNETVRGPHRHVARLNVLRHGVLVRRLPIHGGQVVANRKNPFLRRFDARIADPNGEFTLQSMRDLLSPLAGTEVIPERGAVIPIVTRVRDLDNSQASWAEGTHINTVAHASGYLTLG